VVITDLGVLEPHPATRELRLSAVHPGVEVADVRAETGWDLEVVDDPSVTEPPTSAELKILRGLKARTEARLFAKRTAP
jgi:glutaconate CoA-transferase subunit B